jgi:hypothetical protein
MLPRDKSHNSMDFEIKLVEAEQEACNRTRKAFEPWLALDHPPLVLWVQHLADISVQWLVTLTQICLSWDIQS